MELLVNDPLYILMVLCVCGRVFFFLFFIFYYWLGVPKFDRTRKSDMTIQSVYKQVMFVFNMWTR